MARTNLEGPASTGRDRTLSAVLRNAWEQRKNETGVSMRALAAQVGTSHSTLHRWFSGQSVPPFEDVIALTTALGVVGDEKEAILDLARNPAPNLVTVGPPGVSQQLAGVLELERTAASMVEWLPLAIPGLLQTAGYARAVIRSAGPDKSESEVEHLVMLRLGRQNAILRDKPIRLHALIGRPAIEGRIGGREVMVEQLRHLLRAVSYDAVTLQVVPVDDGWHDGLLGPFVLYDFPEHPSIVHLEHHRSGVFLDNGDDVESYRRLVGRLTELAWPEDQSRELITRTMESWETT